MSRPLENVPLGLPSPPSFGQLRTAATASISTSAPGGPTSDTLVTVIAGGGGIARPELAVGRQRPRDEVLDNITLTWVTNTGVSSGRLCWENNLGFFDVKGASVPAAVSVFPNELYRAPRSWAEQAYLNLVYFNEVDNGIHFAAWQEPELFTTEVRTAFRSLRDERRLS